MTEHRVIDIKTGRPVETCERRVLTMEEWRQNINKACNSYHDAIHELSVASLTLNKAITALDHRLKRLERPWYKKLPFMRNRRHDD